MYQALAVKEGETLSFGMAHGNGCRGYIAFAGGLDIPLVMGSKSTLMRNKMGGMDGRKLEAKDRIGFAAPVAELPRYGKKKAEAGNVFTGRNYTAGGNGFSGGCLFSGRASPFFLVWGRDHE